MGNRLIYLVHSLRTRGVTWRPDVEIVTHYPEILDCELHVMTGLDFQILGGGGWGRRLVSFSHPPTSPFLSTHLPLPCLCPNSGKNTLQSTVGALSEWGRWPLPLYPRAGTDATNPALFTRSFPLSSYWFLTFFNFQILSSSSSIFLHHSQFLTRIYYFGHKRWVIRIPGSGISPNMSLVCKEKEWKSLFPDLFS